MTDDQVGIEHFETGEHLGDVAGGEHFLTRHIDESLFAIGVFDYLFEINFLEVEDDVGNIFLHARYSVEFVLDAINLDGRDGITFKRRQENAAQRIAYGDTIARLQWLELKLAEAIVGFQHQYLIGFLKC